MTANPAGNIIDDYFGGILIAYEVYALKRKAKEINSCVWISREMILDAYVLEPASHYKHTLTWSFPAHFRYTNDENITFNLYFNKIEFMIVCQKSSRRKKF